MRPIVFPALALAALFALPVQAQSYPVLSQADADRLLARLDGNLAMLVERGKPAMVLLDDLLAPDSIFDVHAQGAIDGLEGVSWPYPGSEMPRMYFDLAFGDMDDASRFADGIERVAGVAPDPACTSAAKTHWVVSEDLSIALRFLDYTSLGEDGWVNAELSLVGGPPTDANCATTSATPADLVDTEQMAQFFERLLNDPIDLSSAEAVKAWTAPYGTSSYPLTEDCGMGAYIEAPQTLSGGDMLMITMPGCDGAAPDSPLYLSLGSLDMFAFDKVVTAADAVFGRNPTCGTFESQYYAMDKTRTLVVMEMVMSATVMEYNIPIEQFDCGR